MRRARPALADPAKTGHAEDEVRGGRGCAVVQDRGGEDARGGLPPAAQLLRGPLRAEGDPGRQKEAAERMRQRSRSLLSVQRRERKH